MEDVIVDIDGRTLSIESLIAIRDGEVEVKLSEEAIISMHNSRNIVEGIINSEDIYYGINTGFGALSNVTIDRENLAQLQLNLIRSHACGVGEIMKPEHVLMMMAIRANSLAVGHSGIRPEVVETILALINARCAPVIPRIGSLGASGDLAPLSHLALGLIGENEFLKEDDGGWTTISSAEAFQCAGSKPITLEAKEGLSLINGTSQMCTFMSIAIHELEILSFTADCAAACSVEAIKGSHKPFDKRIHNSRPHPGQMISAARIESLLTNSMINESHEDCDRVQDAYSIRCAPQVHGPVIDSLRAARKMLEIELNSATDNPLIFVDGNGNFEVISGGNFHGENLAITADNLAVCAHELASISERRTNLIMSPKWSGQNAFLSNTEGLDSGMMIIQYVSAACIAELHLLANPSSTSNISVSMEKEDHVSMGSTATYRLLASSELLSKVLANELICSCEAINRIGLKPGVGVSSIQSLISELVPPLIEDRSLSISTEVVSNTILSGGLLLS
ncbi:MAG TPA: histidine ammonia-lyase [Candidatus Thalassarchaeaceae archaeon]|nr:histidine ammonia-lyase [Candidatus Thalassarchaeaceae archaeon]